MDRIEFFFDPVCPFAWLTSRWAVEVSERTDLRIDWRFISLRVLNEERETFERHRQAHLAGLHLLRVADAVRGEHGNDGVGAYYAALGTELHTEGRRDELFGGSEIDLDGLAGRALATAGLSGELAAASGDADRDRVVRAETDLALSRTGADVGTPIITFDPDRPDTSSFFGPVVNRIPRGDEAVELWDALATVARIPGVAELKRSLRGTLDFT